MSEGQYDVEWNDRQIHSLDQKLSKMFNDAIEVQSVGPRTHGKPGFMASYLTDLGKKRHIEFECRIEADRITDFEPDDYYRPDNYKPV